MRKAKRKPFAKAQRSWEGKTQQYEKVVLQGFHLSSVSLKAVFFRLWAVSYFSLQSYCTRNLSMWAAIKEAIALAEIRARPILRKKRQNANSLLFFHTTCKALCQQIPTLLDVTLCVPFHTLLHVVGCYWELLHKVETDQTFSTCKQTQHC